MACAHICGSKVTKSARVQKCRLGNFSCFPMDLKVATILGNFGPSEVRALPLAAGINEGGHYWFERVACASGAT